jgi:hypothetical protein
MHKLLTKNAMGYILCDFFTNSGHPGVDVMITVFCDFRQFPAKKWRFFSKTNDIIKFSFVVSQKS